MPGHDQQVLDRDAPHQQDTRRYLFWGTVLQLALRIVLTVFVAVTLLLPRSLRQPSVLKVVELTSASAAQAGAARRGQVLLVEDDNEVAALTREMLNSLGFSVVHASSADAALGALANGRSVDIVLSDIMMPGGISGLELAREIKRREPNLPVVLVTGYAEAAASMEDGKFGLLLKPYTLEALTEALSAELN